MDRRIEKRHARFLESFQYLINTVDNTAKDVEELKQTLLKVSTPLIADQITCAAKFPLSTPEDVAEYVDQEPDLKHLVAK